MPEPGPITFDDVDPIVPPFRAIKKMAVIGDSIAADGWASVINAWTPWGLLTWLRRFLGGRVSMEGESVFAVAGSTVSQVMTNQLPLALDTDCDSIFVLCGINSLTDFPADTQVIIDTYVAGLDEMLANGKTPVIVPIMWKASGATPDFSANLQKQAASINAALFKYAREHKSVVLTDVNPNIMDFGTGYAQDAFLRDKLHPNQNGAMTCGKVIADKLKAFLPETSTLFVASGDTYDALRNPTGNLLTNGLLAGTGGSLLNGATGQVPSSWRGFRSSGSSTATVAFSNAANAKYSTLSDAVITIGGTGDGVLAILDQEVTETNVSAGDQVYLEVEVDYTFTTGTFGGIGARLAFLNGSFATLASGDDGNMNADNGRIPAGSSGTTLRTPVVTVPSGFVYRSAMLQVLTPPSGSCAGVVKARQISLRKVAAEAEPAEIFIGDDFEAPSTALEGRMSPIGNSQWYSEITVSGVHQPDTAGVLTVADGVLKQSTSLGSDVAYAWQVSPETPGEILLWFRWDGSAAQPPVVGMTPRPSSGGRPGFSSLAGPSEFKLLHMFLTATSMAMEIGDHSFFGTTNANYPAAWQLSESYILVKGNLYGFRARLSADKTWIVGQLLNADGTTRARIEAYDKRFPLVVGRDLFVETFDLDMTYADIQIGELSSMNIPNMIPDLDTNFASGLDGLVVSTYGGGGGVARNGPGDVTITFGSTPGSGAMWHYGALANADRVRAVLDAISTTVPFAMGIVPTAGSGAAISNTRNVTGPGRYPLDAVLTGASAGGSFGIVSIGQAGSCRIRGLFLDRNSPLTFAN